MLLVLLTNDSIGEMLVGFSAHNLIPCILFFFFFFIELLLRRHGAVNNAQGTVYRMHFSCFIVGSHGHIVMFKKASCYVVLVTIIITVEQFWEA